MRFLNPKAHGFALTTAIIASVVMVMVLSKLNGETVQPIITGGYDTCMITSFQRPTCLGSGNAGNFANNTRPYSKLTPVVINEPNDAPGVLLYF